MRSEVAVNEAATLIALAAMIACSASASARPVRLLSLNNELATLSKYNPCSRSPTTLLCLSFLHPSEQLCGVEDARQRSVILNITMAAAAVDVGYLAASYSAPEATFHSLLTAPTVELVQSLLTHVEAKARAYDDLQSEKLRSDVELETAVQSGERRARALKAAAEKAQKEAEELRQKAAQEGSCAITVIAPPYMLIHPHRECPAAGREGAARPPDHKHQLGF